MAQVYSNDFYKLKNCLVKIYCSSIADNSKHLEDAQKLSNVFSQLNYDCEIINNFTRNKLIKGIEKTVSNQELMKYDGLINFIISNGYSDSIQCYDGIEVKFDHVISYFTNTKCQNLIGKPKLIIFNLNQKSKF